MRIGMKNLRENFKLLEEKQETTNQGITLIALVVTIVVLLILASVSITAVFGDNGLLQMAKEAGEKTNEAVQNDKDNIGNLTNYIKSLNWDTTKVTAVTTKDGGIVPVPKGFVGSEIEGENTIKDGFVIYENIKGKNLNWQADDNKDGILDVQQDCNQFVWVPADGVSLEYKQDREKWSPKEPGGLNYYDDCKDYWTDVESEPEQNIVKRAESVAKYGGFYVGRYEAGLPESNTYENEHPYQINNRNTNEGTPVVRKGYAAWNYVSQINAKELSRNMYATSSYVTSRLIDSYAWDTICTWLSKNGIDVLNSKSWGNHLDSSFIIKGLYAYHKNYVENGTGNLVRASIYNRTTEEGLLLKEGRKNTDNTKEKPRECYEIETGATVIDEKGNEIDRNKAKNIYDFAGNMWEWTTETVEVTDEHTIDGYTRKPGTFGVKRGGSFFSYGVDHPAAFRHGQNRSTWTVLYCRLPTCALSIVALNAVNNRSMRKFLSKRLMK